MERYKLLTCTLGVALVSALAIKVAPPGISVPETLTATKGSTVAIKYPSFYYTEVDNDNIVVDEADATKYLFKNVGTSNIKISSGIRSYNITAIVENEPGKVLAIYDRSGIAITDVTVKLGEDSYNIASNEIVIPKDTETGTEVVLVTGSGDETMQLLLATIIDNGTELTVTPEEPNTYIKSDRLYVNLDLDEIKK